MSAPLPPFDEDAVLLASFQAEQSAEAFRELVERHLPLVWSVARRVLVSCPALVEDAAQIVFADLARRAPKLRVDAPLGGWLHRHTWFTASKLLRSERRRSAREAAAAAMNANDPPTSETDSSAIWLELTPELDAALAGLSAGDREAVVQRFFEGKNLQQVGRALGVGEEAARKRVDRAVEKLRCRLRRRGVVAPTAAVFAAVLAAGQAVTVPPAGVALSVSGGAWARRGASTASAAGVVAHWVALIRHSSWTAPLVAASVVVTALVVWWVAAFGEPRSASARPGVTPNAPPPLLPAGDPLRAEVVIFNLDDSFARASLRRGGADGDDAALLQQLNASAAPPPDLKKLIPPGTQLALSQVVKAAALEGPCRSGRESTLRDMHELSYGTEFEPPEQDHPEMQVHWYETRAVGTEIKVRAGAVEAGLRQVEINFTHHFAPPAMRLWSVQVREDGTSSEIGAEQPDFQLVSGEATVMARPGETALVASMRLPPPLVASDPPSGPRRLLVFVTIHEETVSAR